MSFLNPAALWAMLPLGGIIVALYLLKMRRQDMRVPASFLWPAQTEEIRANSLFQRLRFSWLLVLQLLAALLVVLAVARPQTMQSGLAGQVTVIVLDSSASMAATDVRPSRFDAAKGIVAGAIREAKPSDRLALIEAGPNPRVVFPLSSDPRKQLSALDSLSTTDSENDVAEALRLAGALVGGIDGARIILVSDGSFAPVTDFSRGKAAVFYQGVGKLSDNLAITALGQTDSPEGRLLYVAVKNFGPAASEGTISLYADGKPLDSLAFKVAKGSTWGKTLQVDSKTLVYEARLEAPDYLKADNYAVAVADPGANLRVLLVGPPDPFTERALGLDPRVKLEKATQLPADAGGQYDVVVFNGVEERPVSARGVLVLGRSGPGSAIQESGTSKGMEFLSKTDDPILKGVDFRVTQADKVARWAAAGRGTELATSSRGALVVKEETAGRRRLYLAFAPLDSDFPLQVGFPIFFANAVTYLGGARDQSALSVDAGKPFSVPAEKEVKVSLNGESTVLSRNGLAVIRSVARVGRGEIRVDGKPRALYASLRSERESNIVPQKSVSLGGGEVKTTQTPTRLGDFWRPLITMLLLVLAFEWWLFVKKS